MIALLIGCFGPTETGPGGMVGTLVDADGTPLVGTDVSTIETSTKTDANGRFAVEYQQPSTHVDIAVDGVLYRRRWLPESDPAEVVVALPRTRKAEVRCDLECARPQLSWQYGPGFEARVQARCGDTLTVPEGLPDVRCKTVPVEATVTSYGVLLQSPAKPVRIEVRGDPPPCAVTLTIDDVPQTVPPVANTDAYVTAIRKPGRVTAWCDGRPATPASIEPGDTLTMDWTPEGPVLDLESHLPWASSIVLHAPEAGWQLIIPATANGRFLLPPLPRAAYEIVIPKPDGGAIRWESTEGVYNLVTLEERERAWVGSLRLAADLLSGDVAVRVGKRR